MTYVNGILSELSREIPPNIPRQYLLGKGQPVFTAFGCVLMEREAGRSYVYMAVNIKTGKSEEISRRTTPLTASSVPYMLEKIRLSPVAGESRLEIDREFGESVSYSKLLGIQDIIFRDMLPEHGYTIRGNQIELADYILNAIAGRRVTFAEAEVGTGKTLSYLIAAILAKRGRMNDFWNYGLYLSRMTEQRRELSAATRLGKSYIDYTYSPIVVSTSSIALQKAIIRDYIPEISRILMEYGVIKTPLTSALRKGKEHYICEQKLRAHIPFEHDIDMANILKNMIKSNSPIDLSEIDGLTLHCKRKICVPYRCEDACKNFDRCRYQQFLRRSQNPEIDIQVCNHNYLLADVRRRADGKKPLIPDYQSLIIDEAHKFLNAAREMYGAEYSSRAIPDVLAEVSKLRFRTDYLRSLIGSLVGKLSDQNNRLFCSLTVGIQQNDDADEKTERFITSFDIESSSLMQSIREITGVLYIALTEAAFYGNSSRKKAQILRKLEIIIERTSAFMKHDDLICWLNLTDEDVSCCAEPETLLCAIPKNLPSRLRKELWVQGLPVILTSGTLSAGGDFTHIKRTLGLEGMFRLTEISKPSLFDFEKNALLYLSENIPFPDNRNRAYIKAIADEIESLIITAHGHTAVLFTSYNTLGIVHAELKKRGLPFPLICLERGSSSAIEQFKASGNGVLLASGSLWEGIDIPGDTLSMLIIVKLPFAVPDPISEYEQTLYADIDEYKQSVIVPEMLIKLKQGFGRLIRNEKDTGAVAILDSRVNRSGYYRNLVLAALPKIRVTSRIEEIEQFMRMMKVSGYFAQPSHNPAFREKA